jgi:ribonucleoside-diphosphate reductase alpha chain
MQYFQLHNPQHVETSVWSANGTDKSVIFCVEVDDDSLTKEEVPSLDLLERVRLTQNNWVKFGKRDGYSATPWLTHNVSNTINVKPSEWYLVAKYIYDHRQDFTGVALLNHEGDKDYPQAPFCQVYSPEEIVETYGDGALLASGLIVDGLHAFSNNLWDACDRTLGNGKELVHPDLKDFGSLLDFKAASDCWYLQMDWVRRAKKFAANYFNGDIKAMTYCLKDVSNWKLWIDLRRNYRPVDWSKFVELKDTTTHPGLEAACAGGKCGI